MFTKFTSYCARLMGRPVSFIFAVMIIVVWAAVGPFFGWSDTHQLIINTATTIITFLMVFIIQNTQNRDNLAIQIKLDELLHESDSNTSRLVGLEDKSEKELQEQKQKELQKHD